MSTQTSYSKTDAFMRLAHFFEDLGLSPIDVEVVLLDDREYDKFIETRSTATLYSTGSAEAKASSLLQETESKGYRIYIRNDPSKNVAAVMGSFLKIYFPRSSAKTLGKATGIFELAFRCYDRLYEDEELRRFFSSICRENRSIFVYAQLSELAL